jgi:hypothetical protein
LRAFANLALPLRDRFALRDIDWRSGVMIVAIVGTAAVLTLLCRKPRTAVLAWGWMVISLIPTSVFARAVNGDRYLLFPLVGGAILITMFAERRQLIVAVAAIVFVIASYPAWVHYRRGTQMDADRVDGLLREINNKIRGPVTRLTFVNLTHAGIANAVPGLLMEAGLPGRIALRQNYSHPAASQQSLVARLSLCPSDASTDRTFIYRDGTLTDVSGSCATSTVNADIRQRPYAWAMP